ncbi:MAG: hypothetical protein HC840_01330 [Leptolyngbyaceae cyanobacterium RM2_2_4]|nr:hypothetical protein [Leptolyngbyaceae cyanobacterium RM2_2_4]
MNIEEAIKCLRANGFDIGDLRVQIAHRRMGEFAPKVYFPEYELVDEKLTADEFFNSFSKDGEPPFFNLKLVAVGRAFRLSPAQYDALRAETAIRLNQREAVVSDLTLETKDGKSYLTEITFKFPTVNKQQKLHLSSEMLHRWVSNYKRLGAAKDNKREEKRLAKIEEMLKLLGDIV